MSLPNGARAHGPAVLVVRRHIEASSAAGGLRARRDAEPRRIPGARRLADFLPWSHWSRRACSTRTALSTHGAFRSRTSTAHPPNWSPSRAWNNAAPSRLGWAIFVEAQQRHPATSYPGQPVSGSLASALVDAERRGSFEETGAPFQINYFLTFLWFCRPRTQPRAWQPGSTRP